MFGKKIHLFTLFGFRFQLDPSWFVIVLLITWTLASAFFPQSYEGLGTATYWGMGVVAALGLFVCVALHEMGHAFVARHYGSDVHEISLFLFGGVAHIPEDPKTPKAEFLMAIMGPIVSIGIGGVLLGVGQISMPTPMAGVLRYLGIINIVLAGFNLLPGFPLDGGRVLRAGLWKWKDNLEWATRIASQVGSGFGFALWGLAVLSLLVGNFIGAVWWFFLGLFLRGAAKMAYRQLVWKRMLEGVPVSKVMNTDVPTVPPDASAERFAEDYLYRWDIDTFPAAEDDRLVGCIQGDDLKRIPRDRWSETSVRDLARTCPTDHVLQADDRALDAWQRLRDAAGGNGTPYIVLDGDRLVGMVTSQDMLRYLSRRSRFEGERIGQG